MLVITRREGEEIVIGDPANPIAVVEVVRIAGEKVRVGVEAHRSIPVHRREVAEQIVRAVTEGRSDAVTQGGEAETAALSASSLRHCVAPSLPSSGGAA